ncbi:putative Na(+)/H(+) antiporter yjbQ [[Clostridium] ultunense Esp]|nr:putative Na(+)/H(+) antiporter yjbQ [[Clostridium] ultunense Esp]
MMENASLNSLMIVVLLSFLVPALLARFRVRFIPFVVAEIMVGLLIGKSGLNLIHEDQWLNLLSLFGIIYLMFLSGLEIDFSLFPMRQKSKREEGKGNPFLIASLLFLFIFLLSAICSFLFAYFGFIRDPFLMTLILSTISLGIVVPVLKERKMMHTSLGQTILLITVIADFVTMILLSLYVSLQSENRGQALLLLVLFVLFFAIYRLLLAFSRKGKVNPKFFTGAAQLGTRGVFALLLLFAALADNFGAESILGAFLAGVTLSLLSPEPAFVRQLESFGYGFLIPIFFVMVGVRLDLFSLFENGRVFLFLPLLLLALFLTKLLPSFLLLRWFSLREALGTGILTTSTLSLLIAAVTVAQGLGLMAQDVAASLIVSAVLTSFIAPASFARLFPIPEERKITVSIVGVSPFTILTARDLIHDGYEVELYGTRQEEGREGHEKLNVQITEVEELTRRFLEEKGAFQKEIQVFATSSDERNLQLAETAQSLGKGKRIILRLEQTEYQEQANRLGLTHFSTLYSTYTLLMGLIEHPDAIRIFTHQDEGLREIKVNNEKYHGVALRNLHLLGDALVLRIYREDQSIIPHGKTHIELEDRLLISGSSEQLERIREELER